MEATWRSWYCRCAVPTICGNARTATLYQRKDPMQMSPCTDAAPSPLCDEPVSPGCVVDVGRPETWVQVNLALSARTGSFRTSAWAVLEQLQALLQTWRQTAPVACWFV